MHSAALRATLTPLSCSPNFPRAQYLDIRTLTHELIANFSYFYSECLVCLVNFRSAHNLLTNSIFTVLNLIQKSLDGDRPAKISIVSVDELSGGGQGVGWEAGIIGGNYQTLLKMSEKKLFLLYATRHSRYVQQKKQYNQTIKLQENSIIWFFVMTLPAGRPQKKTGVGNTRNVKR